MPSIRFKKSKRKFNLEMLKDQWVAMLSSWDKIKMRWVRNSIPKNYAEEIQGWQVPLEKGPSIKNLLF